ncbi:MAG: kynureninase [Pseudomonadota bacterium]
MTVKLPRKDLFHLPDGVIYLDGNSLGALPKTASAAAQTTIEQEWGDQLIRAWNSAGWMDQPRRVGNRIARLIGATEGTVAVGDTLSIKVYQAVAAALSAQSDKGRRVVLSDTGNFPTDLYMAQSLLETMGSKHTLATVAPEDVMGALDASVAVLLLTHVDYRTGRMHDMAALTRAAHDKGIVVVWDMAHSAGAVELDLAGCNAEFAVGCTYKYLNGGPGAPAFIYVRPDLIGNVQPALAGWLGHAAPFAMEMAYRPAPGTERMRVGTPSVIQMAVLEAALDGFDGVSMAEIRAASMGLSERFILEVEKRCTMLTLASPRGAEERGSQVSFAFEHGYAAMQALIANGVIGDFRQPNLMRFGFTPLYVDEDDVVEAAERLERVMKEKSYAEPRFQVRAAVT